jgi:hypothetical protein
VSSLLCGRTTVAADEPPDDGVDGTGWTVVTLFSVQEINEETKYGQRGHIWLTRASCRAIKLSRGQGAR